MLFINIGGTTRLAVKEILSYSAPVSAAIRRITAEAKKEGRYIDVTGKKSTLTVFFMKDGLIYASPLRPETIDKRISQVPGTEIEAE